MVSAFFVDHTPHLFFGSLGVALLVGVVRGAAPRLTRERRFMRFLGIPLVYFALLMAFAHAASFSPSTFGPGMAAALISPASRETAVRKLGAMVRENDKTEHDVEALVALDLAIHDCPSAESDAHRYRARATWPKVTKACGPSVAAARALYEDGRLEDAATAFEAARAVRPATAMTIDELTAYLLTKRAHVAGAALRRVAVVGAGDAKTKSLVANGLECLADAVEVYAGLRTEWAAFGPDCSVLAEVLRPRPTEPNPQGAGSASASAPELVGSPAKMSCVPHRNTESSEHASRYASWGSRGPVFDFLDPIPFASEADGAIARAVWLTQLDEHEAALALMDRELGRYTWNPPLYPPALREEHAALLASAQYEAPGNVWTREDCTQEIRVPANHPLAKRVQMDRSTYDASRDEADQSILWAREDALRWAYRVAVDGLEGERARGYAARHNESPSTSPMDKLEPDARLSLLLGFSSESARIAFRELDEGVRDAAIAGSGTRLVRRLRALDDSGRWTLDVVGETIPEGRASLQSFSRHEARLNCQRRNVPAEQRAPRCTALSLIRALGERHRVARAVGDTPTMDQSRESLHRLLQHEGGAWLRDKRLARLLHQADRMLTVP